MPIHVRCSSPVAPIVLLPGDPDRARWIAQNILEHAQCTTEYRQMLGFTGTYNGSPISIQTTGMGGPSAAIVCEELITLGAKFFIRIGTCGAMNPDMNPGDLMLVTAACMADGTSREIIRAHMEGSSLDLGFPATSDFEFLKYAADEANRLQIPYHLGKVASLDRFYGHENATYEKLARLGICAVEMEAATVLCIAALHNIRAAAMMTVSDLLDGQKRADENTILMGVERMVRVAIHAAQKSLK
ncbi:MAG: purine-nucleoside phosphorylase [Proteobacteria bacterium]|nr:purine-nucleoside phosphorylase [Pseudomonadota bacterium]